MIDIKILLPELKKLVTELSEDLHQRLNENEEVNGGLAAAHKQIAKSGRTSQTFEAWLEDYVDQVAVAWVLSCVFVRFMEDNRLIDDCYIAGEGERRTTAENEHEIFFRDNPRDSDREYFEHVFREVGKLPACAGLFEKGKTPLWAIGPSGDYSMRLLAYWREIDPEKGRLLRSFVVPHADTRFLGDLYEELSEAAQKKYALKQTPVFVEEFILDRTLNPAIDKFGLQNLRLIDPTCGSGHFLLGAFSRLFHLWSKKEANAITAVQKALNGVWGVDINPFAVAIARFRLIVTALTACGISSLRSAPGWSIHVATGDSLLLGSRWTIDGERVAEQQFLSSDGESLAPEIYACEDKNMVSEVLGQQYHVVVGNPPYITVKDNSLNSAYRSRYSTCHRKYSLAVPFTERFFDLCVRDGFVGMLTANSFMKREFGKKLVENFFRRVELTHVIDTAGAYIPGHGTPTVILFGRARLPIEDTVRAVLGIKGEPETLDDPSQGLVWNAILSQIDLASSNGEYISTADVSRETLYSHPWSMGGGGASELHERLVGYCEHKLSDKVDVIGVFGMTNADEVFLASKAAFFRSKVEHEVLRQFQIGDEIRDWISEEGDYSIFPYDDDGKLLRLENMPMTAKWLWRARTSLGNRATFGKGTYFSDGLPWWKWHQVALDRLATPLTIVFPFVASHNHFVLDRGGKVYNRSAPIIKLSADATEEEHFELLGLLNSSTMCFLMKQVSQQKQLTGGDGVRVQSRAKVPYEFAITQMKRLPIPRAFNGGPLRVRLGRLAAEVSTCAVEMGKCSFGKAVSEIGQTSNVSIDQLRKEIDDKKTRLLERMVFLQEEIDFTTYVLYGLLDESILCSFWDDNSIGVAAGQRVFEIRQQRNVDGFSVPNEVPATWRQDLQDLWRTRLSNLKESPVICLIEDDHYKRRWIGRQGLFNHTARQDGLRVECRAWLLSRLESNAYWGDDSPELKSISQLADIASKDSTFLQVANVYRGRDDFELLPLLEELIGEECVPCLPILCFKKSGIRKHVQWQRVWDAQRSEDSSNEVRGLPPLPTYASEDFVNGRYWKHRNKLNIPQERFMLFPYFESNADATKVVGWAGWDHVQRATAIVAYYDARKREGWPPERLTPLLAALHEMLPWIHQWHPEIDPEYNESAGTSFQTLLESEAQELGLTLEQIRNWTPPAKTRAAKKSAAKQPKQPRKKKAQAEADE